MLNYLMVPYLTRVMATGEYGVVTDLYSLIPFALVLLTMGLESGYFRFAGKAENEEEKRKLFATLWGTTLLAAAAFGILAALFGRPAAEVLGYGDTPSLVWLTGVIVALDVAAAMPFARLREQRRRMRYVGVRLASVVVNLALCLVFYSVQQRTGAQWVLVANVAASAVSMLLLVPTVRIAIPRIDRPTLQRVMVYSLPLLVSGVAGTAGEFIDRQMIKWLMPPDVAMGALGVYGATTKLAVIMILFTQMYRLAAEPFFLARFAKGDFARQSALAMRLYIVVAALIFAAVMLARPLVVQIVGEEFRGGSRLLPVLLAANALAGVVLNLSFWYKRAERTWMAIAVTGTGMAVAVALNVALVPRMGYEGAAWARLACEAAMVAVSVSLVTKLKRQYADKGD
jgi:O-antigen/teichoic acid export membrane protein